MTYWTNVEMRRLAEMGRDLAPIDEIAPRFPRHSPGSVRITLGRVVGHRTLALRRLRYVVRLTGQVFGRRRDQEHANAR